MKPVTGDMEERMKELGLNLETMRGLDVEAELVRSFAEDYIAQLDLNPAEDMTDAYRMFGYINDLEISTTSPQDSMVGIRVLRAIMKAIGVLD